MEKLIVVVFDDEAKAFEGLQALQELEKEGELSVFESRVLVREPGGVARVVQSDDKQIVPMIAGGTIAGAIIGLLGGPVGAVVGAGVGALVGAVGDADDAGVTDEFVDDIRTALKPGKVALIADIAEEWMTPLDTRMESIGGIVFRRARTIVETSQEDRDAAANQAEMEQLKVERAQAKSDRLDKIDAKIDHLRRNLENAIERKRARTRLRDQQREAKIQALEAKANQAAGEVRRRQEARIAELRREYAEKVAAG